MSSISWLLCFSDNLLILTWLPSNMAAIGHWAQGRWFLWYLFLIGNNQHGWAHLYGADTAGLWVYKSESQILTWTTLPKQWKIFCGKSWDIDSTPRRGHIHGSMQLQMRTFFFRQPSVMVTMQALGPNNRGSNLGKLFNLSVPQFPHLLNRNSKMACLTVIIFSTP